MFSALFAIVKPPQVDMKATIMKTEYSSPESMITRRRVDSVDGILWP